MQERAIHIPSVDRQKIGQNKADFIIKFDPVLKLQNDMTHEIALDKVTMTLQLAQYFRSVSKYPNKILT